MYSWICFLTVYNQSNATSESFLKSFWLWCPDISVSHPKCWSLACKVLQLPLSGGLKAAQYYYFSVVATVFKAEILLYLKSGRQVSLFSLHYYSYFYCSRVPLNITGFFWVDNFHDSQILVKCVPIKSSAYCLNSGYIVQCMSLPNEF